MRPLAELLFDAIGRGASALAAAADPDLPDLLAESEGRRLALVVRGTDRVLEIEARDGALHVLPPRRIGPDGLGALYVREDLIPMVEPSKVAGRAAASYDFEGGFTPERERITKYELTTTSTPLIAGTIEAAEWFLDSGAEAVFARARELNRYAEARFGRIEGVAVVSPRLDATRTGLFCFAVDGLDAGMVNAFLQQEAKVVCRSVAQFGSVRLSLHAFNTEAEVDLAAETVERAVREGIPDDVEPAFPPQIFAGAGP